MSNLTLITQSKKSDSILKKFYFERLSGLDYLLAGSPFDLYMQSKQIPSIPTSDLYSSDLSDVLSAEFGKKSMVVAGKYREADIFLFKYKDIYICGQCERGDRGSFWSYSYIPNDQKTPTNSQYKGLDKDKINEQVGEAMRQIHWKINPSKLSDPSLSNDEYNYFHSLSIQFNEEKAIEQTIKKTRKP